MIDPSEYLLVNESQELLPLKTGVCRVGVRKGDLFDLVEVKIEDPPIQSLEVVLPSGPVFEGETFELECLGKFQEGKQTEKSVTHLVEWSIEPPHRVEAIGGTSNQFKAHSLGDVKITARFGEIHSSVCELSIEGAVLKELQLHLEKNEFEAGERVPLKIEGIFSNGERTNL